MTGPDERIAQWLAQLEARHLEVLTFAEVSRALRALSSCYVERRRKLGEGAALEGAGKRAAFALYYGPLHFLLVHHILLTLEAGVPAGTTIVDIGCGTGVGGAAWALAGRGRSRVLGVDRSAWAVGEAAWTWRALGVDGKAVRSDAGQLRWPRGRLAIIAAYAANELPAAARDALLEALCQRAALGDAVLVVEPIAGGAAPWWPAWRDRLGSLGARADEWRVRVTLPSIVERLDRAVGLRHEELTGRSLYLK